MKWITFCKHFDFALHFLETCLGLVSLWPIWAVHHTLLSGESRLFKTRSGLGFNEGHVKSA